MISSNQDYCTGRARSQFKKYRYRYSARKTGRDRGRFRFRQIFACARNALCGRFQAIFGSAVYVHAQKDYTKRTGGYRRNSARARFSCAAPAPRRSRRTQHIRYVFRIAEQSASAVFAAGKPRVSERTPLPAEYGCGTHAAYEMSDLRCGILRSRSRGNGFQFGRRMPYLLRNGSCENGQRVNACAG